MKKNYFKKNSQKIPNEVIKNIVSFKNIAFIVILLCCFSNATGQGASCATATAVNLNQEYTTFSITDATVNDPTPATCNGQSPVRDGWFSFVANGTEANIITTATNRNPILYAYSGTCGVGLTFMSCANATTSTGGHTETLSLSGLTSGVTYYVRVGNSTNNNMSLSSFVIITNDKCSNAQLLTSNTSCVTINGSTSGATDNNEVGDCTTGAENAVWFQFQAVTTTHIVTVDGITGFDPVLSVINTCGVAGSPTGGSCIDNTADGGIETLTLTGLTVGNFYKIQVHDFQGDLISNGFTICVTHSLPPTITNLLTPSSGCVGSSITITGTNLLGATAANVKIGGTSVSSITSNDGSTLVAVIGAGTTGTVSVTTAGGTATSIGTFTVNPLPASISGAATVCTGTTTTLTNITAGGTWSIINGTGSASISTTGDVTGTTAGTITVVYTLPTTCSVTKALTVQQSPGAIAGGTATVCVSASTPAFTNPNAGGTWSVTNGTGTATITAGGVLTGTAAGTVTVNYTIGSCIPATYSVTVNPIPAAIAGGAATVCTGANTVAFTDATAGGTWSITNGTGSATISIGGVATGSTAGTVNVVYTLPSTCSVTKALTVQQTPGAIAGGAATVCVSASTPAFTNPNAGGTWSVTNGTGTATISVGGVLTGTAAGTVTVNYTIGSCTPATYSVTVNPIPAAIAGGAATVCTGANTVAFTDATAGGTWSITNGTGSATISIGGVATGSTAGTVNVVYTLPSTCSVTKALTVQQTPGAIAGGAATVCVSASTPAFTNPNGGGTWSVTNGTGTATITAGGVLTGTAAGTVTVNYTIGSCTPATYAVTVNPLPTNPGNPTSDSPQCNPPGVTLTRAAAPPGSENYYWQTVSLGTNTSNSANTYNATTSGTYYIRSQIISTGCWSSGQGSATVVVNNSPSTLATVPSPANSSTGICYSGSGAITNVSWTAAAGATSYDVYFGAGSLPGSITSNVATTSYTTGALLASTTYYWKIVPKNACGITTGTPITWIFTTASAICYCTPTYSNGTSFGGDEITNVSLGTLNNSTGASASPYYTFYNTATIPNLSQSTTASISITFGSGSSQYAAVWIDFNQNGVFEATEGVVSTVTGGSGGTITLNIPVPAGAILGNTRMRVRGGDDSALTTAQACGVSNSSYGETEDYIVNIIGLTPCTTPTSQPTSLVLSSITTTTIAGAFTNASTIPSGYLIVRSTSATPPSPINGTTYAVGSTTFGVGTLVIQGSVVASTSTSFSDTSLTSNTKYYYYIFSYNNACSGAPFYFTTSPLSNNAITCVAALSSAPVNSAITGTSCTITWGASPAGGSAATINYTLEVYSDSGYSTPISGSPFSVGTAITYSLSGLNGGTVYYYRVKASNGSCDSPYQTGTVTTTITNDNCSGAVLLTVNPNSTCIISSTGTTTGATQSQVGCTGNADDDVWFRFVATGISHIVTVTPLTLNNAVFEVFNGNCASLASTICVNNTSGSSIETTTLTGLTSGQTYYVRVYSNGNGTNTGTFTICITSPVPPSNNQCANATTLPCGTSNLAGTTVLAASYTHGTGCLMSNYGVWYTFTGDGNSSTISVTTTNNDIELSISSGSCGNLTNIACQDSALSNGTETYTFTTAIGVTYYVYIANYYSGGTSSDTGTFTISRTCVVPYNPCTSISNIASCGSGNTVTIPSGIGGYSPSSCGWTTPGVEKIYTFTPASSGNFTITQASSFTYIDYQFKPVLSGCSSAGWSCIDTLSGAGTTTSFTLTAGVQYYILLDPESSSGGSVNFTINCPTPPLTNDEPCNAIALTVSTTCSYSTYTNSGAAGTGGVTAPGCANYDGGDVWFTAVVPATGELDVDLQSGAMTDSGMAFYSGTCGSLTLLECDDDDSNNGSMSYISMNGLTPGQIIYIRVWEYGNDNNGTFGICATTPSCPSPADLYANILSTTSITVNWTASTPPASGGYHYFINTTGIAPTAATTPTGSTAAGVIGVTLTGLTPGLKYYFWVRSYCGGSDTSAWFGPTNYTPCAVGNGTGITTNQCPSVVAGGQGLSGANPAAMMCSSLTCANLEATYLQLNQATNYSVASIPYSPPYQYTCLQNPVSVNVDDIWSSTINLPFNFCFYGNNYNKCLIGSNGVITFDTTTYSPGGYSTWSFNTNLPDVSLFKNTIFGVYQDIDPSKGGQVGWELITLNTGCRALVASWNDIPMFSSSCNSQLYTGMIVLYENTNVIEVYVKEKNVCSTWNNGNAIVGIQNSTGTAAVVPPSRNGLDTNWTASGEAWRFTPTGPSLTSIKWYEGNGTSGTQLGTTDTINVCPTVTTTYTAEVTYALCSGTNLKYTDNVVVTVNGNKIWNGSTDTNWNVSSNWTPSGVPTNANCVVVPVVGNGRYPLISAAPDAVGYNLAVYSNASLTVGSSQNLIITDKIDVQSPSTGALTVNNNANLIQINDTAVNTGSIFYKRIAPNIKGSDYVYWSSPVFNQNIGSIYDIGAQGYRYQWNPILNNGNGAGGNISQGFWESASGIMTRARGYIIRGSSSFGMPASSIPVTFNGTPFNGIIPYTVERGSYTGVPYNGANGVQITNLNDNYNLVGNPYPSSINALKFLQLNTYDITTNPTGQILGNVKLWLHGIDPTYGAANPFYGSYLYNYSANDYLTLNYLGSTTPSIADIIKAGQAFFVQMVDGATGSGTINFNNSMRYDGSILPYNNSNFFKNGNTINSDFSFERNRIWLDLVDANSQSSRILLGYATNATNNYDPLFDAITAVPSGMKLFSMIENDTEVYEIQGRSLPFDTNDEILIGIKAPVQGNYTFAIGALDGLFNTQNIYLKDNLLNITHDLKTNPYHFTTTAGTIKDRFKIIYIDNVLGTIDYTIENNIKIITNEEVTVSSSNLVMESIIVYNVLGQKLNTYNNVNSNFLTLFGLHKNNSTLLLKIKLQTGETVIKKILF
ncbi:fibronectin type III domain-containing protein [Flavobacterium sp. N1994]|uniref:fibronectin type III domain-containing protein n=1 Tax=Flavobacterium sp. N1994 TaxID=2986827 RepID=UPI002221E857|nr:GEVED domain-containing protein [Flavobacterium sp. N1994]